MHQLHIFSYRKLHKTTQQPATTDTETAHRLGCCRDSSFAAIVSSLGLYSVFRAVKTCVLSPTEAFLTNVGRRHGIYVVCALPWTARRVVRCTLSTISALATWQTSFASSVLGSELKHRPGAIRPYFHVHCEPRSLRVRTAATEPLRIRYSVAESAQRRNLSDQRSLRLSETCRAPGELAATDQVHKDLILAFSPRHLQRHGLEDAHCERVNVGRKARTWALVEPRVPTS